MATAILIDKTDRMQKEIDELRNSLIELRESIIEQNAMQLTINDSVLKILGKNL